MAQVRQYIDNTDWVVNPSCCIRRGGPFALAQSRGRRLPRLGQCKQPSEAVTACEDFLASLYCIYFTSWSRSVPFTSVLCVFCACIVRFSCCLRFFGQHTAGQHVFPPSVRRGIGAVQPVWS